MKIKPAERIASWWRRRRHRSELRRRFEAFEADPAGHTRSPWIRSLIASPMWHENVREPGEPRTIGVSRPEKAKGRDYILDLLRLERCLRFRGYSWAWRGIFSAMGDDAITAAYPEEYRRLRDELRVACPDETLRGGDGRTPAQVAAMAEGMIEAGRRARRGL